MVSGSEDKSVRVWDISRAALARCNGGGVSENGAGDDDGLIVGGLARGSRAERDSIIANSPLPPGPTTPSPGTGTRDIRFVAAALTSVAGVFLSQDSRFSPGSTRRESTFIPGGGGNRRDGIGHRKTTDFTREQSKVGSILVGRDSSFVSPSRTRGGTIGRQPDLSTQFESRDSVAATTTTTTTTKPILATEPAIDAFKLSMSTSSSDGSVRSPCLLRVLHGHAGGVRSLDFQGSLLFTGDIHGCVRAWHIDRYRHVDMDINEISLILLLWTVATALQSLTSTHRDSYMCQPQTSSPFPCPHHQLNPPLVPQTQSHASNSPKLD